MKDMIEVFSSLQNTPVPNILVLLGAGLILLAFVGKIGAMIELNGGRQLFAGIVGVLSLSLGIFMYLTPSTLAKDENSSTALLPTDTPTATVSVSTDMPTPMTPTMTSTLTETPTPTKSLTLAITPTPPSSSILAKVCGEAAFVDGTFASGNPQFQQPDGYSSGWMTSDPSQVVLPDGSVQEIPIRYVLVVNDLPTLQLKNVSVGNTWGCWLRTDISSSIMEDANHELERMKKDAPNAMAGIFIVNADGLNEVTRR